MSDEGKPEPEAAAPWSVQLSPTAIRAVDHRTKSPPAIAEFITATLPTDPHRPVVCRGRAIAAQLPHSPAGPVCVRRPHTRLQTGLAHIQRRDPLHHQFDIVDFMANARFADERLSGSVAAFSHQPQSDHERLVESVASARGSRVGSR